MAKNPLAQMLLDGMRLHNLTSEVGSKVEKVACIFGCASSDACNITVLEHNVVSGKMFQLPRRYKCEH